MSDYTPGPWRVVGGPSKYNQVFAEAAKTSETSPFLTGWVTPANAHLIAAAPALLEAAEGLMAGLDMVPQPAWASLSITPEAGDAIAIGYDALRAAIHLAKGNQP